MKDEVVNYLNNNLIEPTDDMCAVMAIIGIEFINEAKGWQRKPQFF